MWGLRPRIFIITGTSERHPRSCAARYNALWHVLANGTVSINMTSGLTVGYSETYPAVTPTSGINKSSVNQQTLGVKLVTDGDVLSDLKGYFEAASRKKTVDAKYKTSKEIDGKTKETQHEFTTETNDFIFSDDSPASNIPSEYYSETFKGKTVYVSTKEASLNQLTSLTLIFMRRIAASATTSAPKPAAAGPALQGYPLLR